MSGRAIMSPPGSAPRSADELAARIAATREAVLAFWDREGIARLTVALHERVTAWLELSFQEFYRRSLGAGDLLLANEALMTRIRAILEEVRWQGGDVDAAACYLMISYQRMEQKLRRGEA